MVPGEQVSEQLLLRVEQQLQDPYATLANNIKIS